MFLLKGRAFLRPRIKPSFALQKRLFQITNRHFNDINNDIQGELIDFKEPIDSDQLKFKQFIEKRSNRVNRYEEYKRIKASSVKLNIETYDAFDKFSDIIANNEETPPTVGSLVEFIDPISNSISFGVVLRESSRIFNESYNTVTVLTLKNEIVKVYPTFIKVHLLKVFKESWIESLGILENRLVENNENRKSLVNSMEAFIGESKNILELLQAEYDILYSQHSQHFNICPITLTEVVEKLDLKNIDLKRLTESYYYQSCLIFSCHLKLIQSYKWIASNSLFSNKLTNLSRSNCSNQLVSPYQYFSNSIYNSECIDKFLSVGKTEKGISEINKFLMNIAQEQKSSKPKSLDELNLYFNIWEGRQFKYIIDVLKYCILYPHHIIIDTLSKLEVFSNKKVTPTELYSFLKELNIYDNDQNQLSDIVLSANIAGRASLSQIAISSIADIDQSLDFSESIELGTLKDKFEHLRSSKKYFQDHTIYGIPYLKDSKCNDEYSMLAISLEKINSRKYLINVHIPDIISKLSPSSSIYGRINSMLPNVASLTNFINEASLALFDKKFISDHSFKNQNLEDADNWYRVGDLLERKKKSTKSTNQTCMTISFTYNMYESNPFADLSGKINISFDNLNSVTIKNVDWKSLEETLDRNEESPFRFFTRKKENDLKSYSHPVKLIQQDLHNIKFIYNIMKSHFKIRNIGTAAVDETFNRSLYDSSNLQKELSIHKDLDNEKIVTKVSLTDDFLKTTKKSRFFINELDMFVSNLVAQYCSNNKLPIVNICQDLFYNGENGPTNTNSNEDDEVLVSHNNLFLPNFHASSYFHTLLSRDANGYLSKEALVIGKNYLNKKRIEVLLFENTRNIPLGLKNGYIPILNVFKDYKSILNQLQLLLLVQFNQSIMESTSCIQTKKYSYLKRYGYNLHGGLSADILSQEINNIQNAASISEFLGLNDKYFWTLRMLEQQLLDRDINSQPEVYECIITSNKYYVPELESIIVRGYCKDLDIEVDIITSKDDEKTIGSRIECDKITHLDPINFECVLEERLLL